MEKQRPTIPDPVHLPAIIVALRAEYEARGITAYDIGNGLCDDFARDVLSRWVGEDWIMRDGQGFEHLETGNFIVWDDGCAMDWDWALMERHWSITPPEGVAPDVMLSMAQIEPGHVWISTGGRHYDAEHPEGVPSFFELMFFRRWADSIAAHRTEPTKED